MRAVVEVNVDCTITNEFLLLDLARAEVDALKPLDDRALYYPSGPAEALQQIIRSSIAARLQACEAVSLHEIGHRIKQFELPL